MNLRVALDTNVLAYAEGVGDLTRREASLALLSRLPQALILLPVQVLGELYRVLISKAAWDHSSARDATLQWKDSFHVMDSTWGAFQLRKKGTEKGDILQAAMSLWTNEPCSVVEHDGAALFRGL